jgi:sugar (pentulose or hexulose) kinase
MREQAIAVLDIGKTNAKLLAIDAAGRTLAATTRPCRVVDGALDSEAVWEWSLAGLRDLAVRFDITAIVPVAHGAAGVLVDAQGPVHPAIDYEAIPPAAIDAEYDALRPAFAQTFSPRLPAGLNLGRQLYWIARTAPDALARATAFLTYPQYFAWRLSGVMASEATSLGCHTDLWRPDIGAPSDLVAQQGWNRLLPPLRRAYDRLGRTRPELGLPSCDVLCGIHDSNAAYLGYLAGAKAPFAVVSTGTWVVCFNGQGDPAKLDPARDTLVNVDARGKPVTCARFMGGREYEMIAGDAVPSETDLARIVARRAMALPSFAETGGPFPGHKGHLVGTLDTPGARASAATLYLALMTRETLDLTGPATRIYIDGAFVANPLYAPLLATLMPAHEIFVSSRTDGTASGAAILARWTGDAPPTAQLDAKRVMPLDVDLDAYATEWRAAIDQT